MRSSFSAIRSDAARSVAQSSDRKLRQKHLLKAEDSKRILNLCCQCYCQYYQCCQYWVFLHRCGATPKLSFAGEMGVSLQQREHLKPLTIFWTYLIVKVHHHFSCVLLDTENLAQLRYSASNTMNNCSNKNLPKETKWQKKSVQNLKPAVFTLWWWPLLFL